MFKDCCRFFKDSSSCEVCVYVVNKTIFIIKAAFTLQLIRNICAVPNQQGLFYINATMQVCYYDYYSKHSLLEEYH